MTHIILVNCGGVVGIENGYGIGGCVCNLATICWYCKIKASFWTMIASLSFKALNNVWQPGHGGTRIWGMLGLLFLSSFPSPPFPGFKLLPFPSFCEYWSLRFSELLFVPFWLLDVDELDWLDPCWGHAVA